MPAGVLYPLFGLLLSPMIAAAAMSFSSVAVVGNALRLNRMRLSEKIKARKVSMLMNGRLGASHDRLFRVAKRLLQV